MFEVIEVIWSANFFEHPAHLTEGFLVPLDTYREMDRRCIVERPMIVVSYLFRIDHKEGVRVVVASLYSGINVDVSPVARQQNES